MAVTAATGTKLLGELMEAPPPLRSAWLRTLDRRGFALVTDAAADHLGTPFGLWADDCPGFFEFVLREPLWSKQREIAEAISTGDKVAVPACHGPGKTWWAGGCVAWFLTTRAEGSAQAVTTATRWRQVRTQLWPRIRSLHARHHLPGDILQTEWHLGGLISYGFSPADNDETAFSGIHAPELLVMVDEAGGISPTLGKSVETTTSGLHVKLVLLGNPPIDEETGSPWFEEMTHRPDVTVIRISAFDTPNFTGEETADCGSCPSFMDPHPVSRHLVQPAWVEGVERDYGKADPFYIARVEARFPKDATAKAIPRGWLDECVADPAWQPAKGTQVRLGVDVASDGGDEFVIARTVGFRPEIVHAARGAANANPVDLAGRILQEIEEAEALVRELGGDPTGAEQVRVKVDAIGIGWGPTGTLEAWGDEGRHHAAIVAVNVSEAVEYPEEDQEKYANKRAQMWWLGRELSKPREGIGRPTWALPDDEKLLRQLSGPKYGHTSGGMIRIEKKADMAKRGVPSPDRAEAVLLSVYEPWPGGPTEIILPGG
jgi:hypothetical protein